jgi:hypothetical protein
LLFQSVPDTLEAIVRILVGGLAAITGRSLIEVFKAISTVFEKHFAVAGFAQYARMLIDAMNQIWQDNLQRDSVVCPLLECLVTGYETSPDIFSPYTTAYLTVLLPLLSQQHRTAMVLRCIDLLSSIVNRSGPQELLASPPFL